MDESEVPVPAEEDSLRRRAARRLLDLGSKALTRVRLAGEAPAEVTQDLLLLETQHSVYVQLHRRWVERAQRGDRGLRSALEALDAMWDTVRQLRGAAPIVLGTLSNPHETVQDRRAQFYLESTHLLEDAIRIVFATDLGLLALPPERLAVLVRITIEGLVVELAQARTPEDVAVVDRAYLDLRALFERFVVGDGTGTAPDLELTPIPLPW
jgi:hypothetical protein